MTERVSVAVFMAQNPHLFWALIHIAWGSIYGSITCSLLFVAVVCSRYLKQRPDARTRVVFVQVIWAAGQLIAVFSIPWLIGVIDKDVLIAGVYVPYFLGTWVATIWILWWIFSRQFSFKDLQ